MPISINKLYRKSQYGVYMTAQGKEYKERMTEYVAMEAMHQDWQKVEKRYLYMDEIVYMNRKSRDSDNLKKLTQDCITESNYVWTDDTYCLPRTNRIYIDSEHPRIEITISPTEFVGIFNSQEEFNTFDEVCRKCSKFGRCALRNDILENRIISEIQFIDNIWMCTKFKEIKVKKSKK